jgi:L-2-hydroxyglutarate oxidase LhgO
MSDQKSAHVVVVGAGVVGLAVARALAAIYRDVLVLENNPSFGREASSRNSEVIHAGLYYPKGSLKAQTCLRGGELLRDYAARRGVEVRKIGKLIVGCSHEELSTLERLHLQAQANGVDDLRCLSAKEIAALEPDLSVQGALLSPSTGIVDSHALMHALLLDAQAGGARVQFCAPVTGIEVTDTGFAVRIGGAVAAEFSCRILVNCAGLGSVALAEKTIGLDPHHVPGAYHCKGSYFVLPHQAPFRHLIYPVPQAQGLGVHLTLDLLGRARFGPDTEWVEAVDYEVDPRRAVRFEEAILRYWPGLPRDSLRPAYAGVRAKIVGPGGPSADFRVDAAHHHGVPGLVNLFGIESPGLTAALALAEHVVSLVQEENR